MATTGPTREAVYGALFALLAPVQFGSPPAGWQSDPSRRLKLYGEVPAPDQPAVFQAEHATEEYVQLSNLPYRRIWKASWVVYHKAGDASAAAVPAIVNNLILDALEAAIAPIPADPGYPKRNTLGRLVHHCFIDGNLFKDPGDLDGQAMLIVPITMLVP